MMDSDGQILALEDTAGTGVRVVGFRLLGYSVGFVASVLIARELGPEGRGLYAFPVALLGVAIALSNLGLEHANIYLVGRGVAIRELWANTTIAAIIIGVVAWIAVALVYALAGARAFGGLPFVWIAIAVGQVPLLLQTLYWSSALQLSGRAVAGARAAAYGAAVHAAVTLTLFLSGVLTPFRVLVLTLIANGMTWIVLLVASRRGGLVGAALAWVSLRRAVVFGVKAHAGLVFFFLMLRVDQILVQRILGYQDLGLYSLAVVLAELIWLASDPFAISIVPHQARAGVGDETRLGLAAARLGLWFSLPVAVVAWVAAPFVIQALYGGAFESAVWPFRLLLPGVVALSVYRPLATALLTRGRVWLVSGLGLMALAVNVVANLALLAEVGVAAASISSSLAYAILAIAYVALASRAGVMGWRDLMPRVSDVRLLRSALLRSDVRQLRSARSHSGGQPPRG